jgi:tRNA A37 N6-isopentenylltransferase MiaA
MLTEVELRAGLIRATRRYAKRQQTWFRSEPDLVPIDVTAGIDAGVSGAAALVREQLAWYDE